METQKNLRIVKIILNNKITAGNTTLPDFKLCYRAIVIRMYDAGIQIAVGH